MISLLNDLFIEFEVIPSTVQQKVSISVELPKNSAKKRTAIKSVSFLDNSNKNDKDYSLLSHLGHDA